MYSISKVGARYLQVHAIFHPILFFCGFASKPRATLYSQASNGFVYFTATLHFLWYTPVVDFFLKADGVAKIALKNARDMEF
jgi:hypothetical protein